MFWYRCFSTDATVSVAVGIVAGMGWSEVGISHPYRSGVSRDWLETFGLEFSVGRES